MNIGFVGLGKLGLPCGLAIEQKGHIVFGIDPGPLTKQVIETRTLAYLEEGAQSALEASNIKLVDMSFVVREADLIFIAVQTPHDPRFEGVTPISNEREDFNYSYLCAAVESLCQEIQAQGIEKDIVVISTVLPGTMQKYIRPIIQRHNVEDKFHLVYNPFFIAMGTTMRDFLHPEFILMGADSEFTANKVKAFYASIHDKPVFQTTVENAELIKVIDNTFIGMKIAFANTVMEICHKTPGTDCDQVVNAISLATERLLSPKYLRGGMGDGGGCHPRDNIALSWLAKELNLSHDMFEDIMIAREDQTKWLTDLIVEHLDLPLILMGWSFKPNTNIIVGSPARLLSYYLNERGIAHEVYDPIVCDTIPGSLAKNEPALFFVSTQHDIWKTFEFPNGSTVIDPFRYLHGNKSITKYVPIGVG